MWCTCTSVGCVVCVCTSVGCACTSVGCTSVGCGVYVYTSVECDVRVYVGCDVRVYTSVGCVVRVFVRCATCVCTSVECVRAYVRPCPHESVGRVNDGATMVRERFVQGHGGLNWECTLPRVSGVKPE